MKIVEENAEDEKLRPEWKALLMSLERGDELVLSKFSNASDITPSWFKKGVEAALLAPTAVNQQKFSFEHVGVKSNCHQIRAKKGFSMIGYTQMDLGIAKYHFDIGAGKENFIWV